MSRSSKKGPYIYPKLLKKMSKQKAEDGSIKTWARNSSISPEMVGYVFSVHNGKNFIEVRVTEEMIGHKLGEFSPTRKFVKHGGKMQRDKEKGGTAPTASTAPVTPAAKK
ncbi:MAG: 30S ribosomal protein S19 [Candidatus Paceibacterota bacterium]